MIKAVIFDFNRTLYEPDLGIIPTGNLVILENLKAKGYKTALITVDENNNLKPSFCAYFDAVRQVKNKTLTDFKWLLQELKLNEQEVVVIGDRIKGEIRLANALGITTIWLCRGKYAKESPTNEAEQPNYCVDKLEQLLEVINYIESEILN